MTARMFRRVRAWWHRREVAWLLDHLGLASLAELEAFLDEPFTPAMERFLEVRERIMWKRNPMKLIREAVEGERVDRVIAAVLGV